MNALLKKLTGGDRRSIGQSEVVVAEVLAHPPLFADLFAGLTATDPLVRMRAADAVEKLTQTHPEWLKPYKRRLLTTIARIEQAEVRWHVCQLIPRLRLTARERGLAVTLFTAYLRDHSRIVRAFAIQALADLAMAEAALRPAIIAQIEAQAQTGPPAVQSRARKMLARLRATS